MTRPLSPRLHVCPDTVTWSAVITDGALTHASSRCGRQESACHEAPEVATGGFEVVVGALAACSGEVEPLEDVFDCEVVDCVAEPAVVAALALAEAAAPCRVVARATAPTALAAPAPRVIADTQASPFLRAR
jgi:hypothetical protein